MADAPKPIRSLFGSFQEGVIPSVVDHDHACISCGYNLRTLSIDAKCPECAAPVKNSFLSNKLEYSHPSWVGALARGVVMGIVGVSFFVLLIVLVVNRAIATSPGAFANYSVYYPLLFNVPILLVAFGGIFFTKVEKSRKAATADPKSRRFARAVVFIWVGMTYGVFIFRWALRYVTASLFNSTFFAAMRATGLLTLLLTLTILPVMLIYAQRIAPGRRRRGSRIGRAC